MGSRMKAAQEKKYLKIKALVDGGSAVAIACKKIGTGKGNYYYWLKRQGGEKPTKRKKVQELITLPEVQALTGNVVMFYGSPESVAAAARSMM